MRPSVSRSYLTQMPIPKMPPGLVDLIEGMTKEVLKKNPDDIYEFCASYMRKLLDIRDGLGQENLIPLQQFKEMKTQNRHFNIPEKYTEICKEKESLLDEYDVKGILFPNEKVKEFTNINLTKQKVIIPVSNNLDLIENLENEIFYLEDKENNTVIIPASEEKHNTETQVINIPDCLESKPEDSTDSFKINVVNTTILRDTQLEIDFTSYADTVKDTEVLEENRTSIPNNAKAFKDENITEPTTKNHGIFEKNKLNSKGILKEEMCINNAGGLTTNLRDSTLETYFTSYADTVKDAEVFKENRFSIPYNAQDTNDKNNADPVTKKQGIFETNKLKSKEIIKEQMYFNDAGGLPNNSLAENIVIIDLGKQDSISYNMNEQKKLNKGIIIKNNTPDDKELKAEHGQITYFIEDPAVEKSVCELSVHKKDMYFSTKERCNILPETKKDLEDCEPSYDNISQNEITIADEHKQPVVEHVTILDEEDNEKHSTNENNYECQNNRAFNVKDIDNNRKGEVQNNLPVENIFYEKENYYKLHDPSYNKDQLKITSSFKEIDVDIHNGNDVAPQFDKISLLQSFTIENPESKDNAKKAWETDKGSHNMDLETAAITIQKVFRSFLYKSRGSTFEDVANDVKETGQLNEQNKERRALGITRMDTLLQTVNEEQSLSLSTDDSSTLSSAATIIQAHVRGFLLRNKMNSSKKLPTNSLINSNNNLVISSGNEEHQPQNRTVLNIHIVPKAEGISLSQDESVITSVDLSMDCSPPISVNLHPLGYDKSEPRKQLKREYAFQSVSPPSTNSGKLSEDIDSVREISINENEYKNTSDEIMQQNNTLRESGKNIEENVMSLESTDALTVIEPNTKEQHNLNEGNSSSFNSFDESDVVTPFLDQSADTIVPDFVTTSKLIHSGEFHDLVVPTKVTRSDTSVVRGE